LDGARVTASVQDLDVDGRTAARRLGRRVVLKRREG